MFVFMYKKKFYSVSIAYFCTKCLYVRYRTQIEPFVQWSGTVGRGPMHKT